MYRKIVTSLLFLFSFFIVALGGYQCATRVESNPPPPPPYTFNGGFPANNPTNSYLPIDTQSSGPIDEVEESVNRGELPQEPSNTCARKQHRNLANRYGSLAVFKFDLSSLEDYRFGLPSNFSEDLCARMYLSMNLSERNFPKGNLTLSFEDSGSIKVQRFSSGSQEREVENNFFTGGSWTPNSRGKVNKRFYAIFDNKDTAIILKLEDVRVRDIRDGETIYEGAGEIYYKMFRAYTGDNSDVCYSGGTYISQLNSPPPKRARCWLLNQGPFSCRPEGVINSNSNQSIKISRDLKCYTRLGAFYGLNIQEAFHVEDIRDL